jgi:hypothetical protein
MPLTTLELNYCRQVQDLTPLKGMPLTALYLAHGPQVRDLTPLEGMRLQQIVLPGPPALSKGMEVLRRMDSLKAIEFGDIEKRFSAAEFWKRYDAGDFKK